MNRMSAIALSLLLLTGSPAESDAAFADRATLPTTAQHHAYYLSLSDVPAEQREALANVVRVVVPSMSHKPSLPSQLPVAVGDSLLRIDTASLGWEASWPRTLARHYPYRRDLTTAHHPQVPLVSSALWYVAQVTDAVETPGAYYDLLYGASAPRTLAQYQAFWKVQRDRSDFIAFIEGKSGVSTALTRLMENHDTGSRGQSWSTYDSANINAKTDPLENLVPGSLKFDAGEHIVMFPKRMTGRSGLLPAWFLADAQGNRQEKAPADVVIDHAQTRGVEIRNYVSCIACHPRGLADPSIDRYAAYLRSGATITARDKYTQEQIEAYYQSDFAKQIKIGQDEYAAAIDMCAGITPEEFTASFVKLVKFYDADLSLEQAARELGCEPNDLSLALGYATARKIPLSAGLAQLAHGVAIQRSRWETEQTYARTYLRDFQAK